MTLPEQAICPGFLLTSNAIGGWTVALPAEIVFGDQTVDMPVAQELDSDGSSGVIVAFPVSNSRLVPGEDSSNDWECTASSGYYRTAKQIIDIVVATIMFILALPVFAILAIAVQCSSPGGVFFRQTRVGKDMRPFKCLKFRTMVPDAESILERDPELSRIHALNWKLDNDPRVTRVGKFLRKTSLDEIPQLINVINGDMSLIGPRPYLPKELSGEFGAHAAQIMTVRPGMTGLWQVSGRAHLTPHQRIVLDQEYANRASFLFDIQIAVRTVTVVTIGRGAY